MRCNRLCICYKQGDTGPERASLYVCNCNGIRAREVRAAIESGAKTPAQVFRYRQCAPQCAKCVCEMRCMIQEQQQALRHAAE